MRVDQVLADPAYPTLKAFVLSATGLNYYADKDEDLATRIARRIESVQSPGCHSYLQLLTESAYSSGEFSCLVGELTIGETYFFRQREHFDLLQRRIIPERLEANRHSRSLRIWSAGCATGAEPYSINLVLGLEFGALLRDWNVSILATDLDAEFLAKARSGLFTDSALRDTPNEIKDCCFDRSGRLWKLKAEYRNNIEFRQHNLVAPGLYPGEEAGGFDVIFCRNVLIYFSPETVREVAGRLYQNLAAGGWLLVGHAEPDSETFRQFQLVIEERATAYRKHGAREEAEPDAKLVSFPGAPPHFYTQTAGLGDGSPLEHRPPDSPVQWEPPRPESLVLPAAPLPVAATLEDARLLADRGDWPQAAEICHRILAEDSINAPAHFTLGLVLEHAGPPAEAQSAFRRAIYLDRSFALAHYSLGASLQRAGNIPEAQRSFRNVLELAKMQNPNETVEHGEGMTWRELQDLSTMHLEALGLK